MENQGAGARKIVFKHRSVGAQRSSDNDPASVARELESPAVSHGPVTASDSAEESVDTTLHYQGEIFDQFYRFLSALGGDARLVELAAEPLVAPTEGGKPAPQVRAARDARHQKAAEALAKQIYQLAQIGRETDVDVYLSAFNVVLANHSCYDAKDILDRANEFFTEQYYNDIRERGERPEIYHQVVKRVGQAAADRINRIVYGLDVDAVANKLWDLYHSRLPNRASLMADILLECTEKQVRTLRSEFLIIPYRDIARQIRSILSEVVADSGAAARRTIGRNEAYEQKRQQAYRARDQLRALRYLLLGRSAEEVAVIKRYFIELDDSERSDAEKSLDTVLQKTFPAADLDRLGTLLQGWEPVAEAGEIHKLLYPQTVTPGLDDFLSDPRDAVDRDYSQGIGPFLRRFKKGRMWLGKTELLHRVLNVFEVLEERVAALTFERFMATNEALLAHYGYELDPTWFRSFALFDARSIAGVLADRISCAYDFFEMIKPLEFFGPRECLAVQKAYVCMHGIELRDAIERRLAAVRDKTSAAEREELFARYLDGRGRWPLTIDLLGRYRGEEPESTPWSPEFVPSDNDEQLAIRLATEMDQDVKQGELDSIIIPLLEPLSQDDHARLERAFFELTEPPVPLQRALSEVLSTDAMSHYRLMTYGISGSEIVGRIFQDPITLTGIRYLPQSLIKIVRSLFQLQYGQKIDQWLIEQFPLPDDEDVLIDLLSIAYTPEAYTFRLAIQELKRDVPAQIEGLRRFWARELVARMGMERAIDRTFPRFRVLVKQAAARHAIKPDLLSEIILSFEGVSPDLPARILECFDAVDIGGLLRILRDHFHSQRVIEECYDLLFPDGQLRTAIKAMKVELEIINETLLHLDGYSAEDVASEVHQALTTRSGRDLENTLLEIFSPSTPEVPNPRIPEDINWMDEMMYQVGLAYQRLYDGDIFDLCVTHNVSPRVVEVLAERIFGAEVCGTARELHELISCGKQGIAPPDGAEEALASFLESRGVRHRERIIRAYAAYWAHLPGFGELRPDLISFVKESNTKRKILSLLSGLGRARTLVDAAEAVPAESQ